MKHRFRFLIVSKAVTFVFLVGFVCIHHAHSEEGGQASSKLDRVTIESLPPDQRGGKAYKLVYRVAVPIDAFWKFKTDFENDFLVTNKYIREHRLIRQQGRQVPPSQIEAFVDQP